MRGTQCVLIAVLCWVAAVAGVCRAGELRPVAVDGLGDETELIGRLHWPLGRAITVVGVVVEGPFKGYEGGPNLRPQKIHGTIVQEDIQIRIRPYFRDWGKESGQDDVPPLPILEMGKTYEMEGYETGGYIGIPGEAYAKAGYLVQTTGYYFRTEFVVYRARVVEPVEYHPRDFTNVRGLLEGMARSREGHSWIEGATWSVCVSRDRPWDEHVEGRRVESFGLYNAGSGPSGSSYHDYDLVDGTWRLVRLEDQVGRAVELRGRVCGVNGEYWLRYRGVDLYVEDMAKLPGWSSGSWGRAVAIRGRLETARLPRLDQITLKSNRDMQDYYIVRAASWEDLPGLLGPERPIEDSDRR